MNTSEAASSGTPLFNLGLTAKTRGVNEFLKDDEIIELMNRHQRGDWSEMTESDQRENDYSVRNGLRIFSSYIVRERKIWVITEADRSSTTILFPYEY